MASADCAEALSADPAAGYFEDAGTRRIRGMSKRMHLYRFAWPRYLQARLPAAAASAGADRP